MWMKGTYPHIQFERYADDAICHCKSAEEAQALWSALADRSDRTTCPDPVTPARILVRAPAPVSVSVMSFITVRSG
jgi:hypothetical protein